jgi:hypothetical protein
VRDARGFCLIRSTARALKPARTLYVGLAIASVVALAATVATLLGAFLNLRLRAMDGVEGELLFEASRIRDGLLLYTDPAVGAFDYGAVPARYYVLYPPLWAAALSVWPATWALHAGRAVSVLAWWGVLAEFALSARRPCRGAGWLAALFVGGVYSLAEFGGSARPDSVALALAGIALARSARKGEVDALGGALFALAAWTKPNVVGMGAGAVLACAWMAPRAAARALAGALAVTAVVVPALERASAGTWLLHLAAATGQPLHARLFAHHLEARGQFFLAFLALAGLFAWSGSRKDDPRARREASILLFALVFSVAWACFTFAKVGSAANYWMEPCLAGVLVFSRVPAPELSARARLALGFAVPFQALWTGVGSVRASLESIDANRAHARLLERARSVCGAAPDSLVVADEPGVEMTLDGRLIAHPFPLTHQALRGRYSLEPWIADLSRPEVGCVVTMHDRIERPPGEVDVDYDYFAPPVRSALFARFAPAAEAAGWEVYAQRGKLQPP